MPAAVAWAALGYKLSDLRRSTGTAATRALLAILVWLALATTFFAPPVYVALGQATGEPNLAILLAQSCGLVGLWPACNLLLYQWHSEDTARRIARRRYLLLPVPLIAAALLWSQARGDSVDPHYVSTNAQNPTAVAFLMVHHLGLAVTGVYCWRSCTRRARTVSRDLRWGLRLVAGAGAATLVMVAYDVSFFTATLLGASTDLWGEVPVMMALMLYTATTLFAVGATVPDWGPRALHAARAGLALRRLRPLWRGLTSAVPGVVLDGAYPRRHVSRRLHRMVVEIRDAQLALRPYQPTLDEVASLVKKWTPATPHREAFAEAADLALAVRAKRAGVRRTGGPVHEAVPMNEAGLQHEVAWLVQVARHWPQAYALSAAQPGSAVAQDPATATHGPR